MKRNSLGWMLATVGLIGLAAASAPAFPANPKAPQAAPVGDAGKTEEQKAKDKEASQTVETILKQQEDILTGQRFTYDPGGRRDPFRSLYEEAAARGKRPRPRGVAGMLVAEVELTGIIRDAEKGNVAVLMGSDNKGYFLRVGDDVYDGTVIAIDPVGGTVTFRQQVDDPRLIKPYRDVVKRLVAQEEERAQ